jgi:hypothetical protein
MASVQNRTERVSPEDGLLRHALLGNAAFSTLCALVLLIEPELASRWLGISAPALLTVLAIGLLVFAVDLVHQATRTRMATWRALYASAADFAWVLGTLVALPLLIGVLPPMGVTLVTLVAAVVLLLGATQLVGIARIHGTGRPGEYRHCIRVATDVPAREMWSIVSDLGGVSRYMPALRSSRILDDHPAGRGAVRLCEDRAGRQWSEECTEFRDGEGFTVRFAAEAPDFPFPATHMRGGWEVAPRGSGCEVQVWWEMTPRHAMAAPLMLPLLALRADRDFPAVIARMAAHAKGQAPEPHKATPASRLLPESC